MRESPTHITHNPPNCFLIPHPPDLPSPSHPSHPPPPLCSVALLIGARPRGPGMDRKDLLKANAAIFEGQGKALDSYASRKVKVLVVGNPANTNALITRHFAPSLPPSAFTAMTRLDQNRAQAQIAKEVGGGSGLSEEHRCVGKSFQHPVPRRLSRHSRHTTGESVGDGGSGG